MPEKRVLLVDDSAIIRQLIIILAAKIDPVEPISFVEAIDGQDGYEKFKSERFDLVITDIEMPIMNGLELISRLRSESNNKTVPILVLSAKCEEDSIERAMKSGADKYLVKPFSTSRFKEAVADMLGCKRAASKASQQSLRALAEAQKKADIGSTTAGRYNAFNSYEQDFWALCTFKKRGQKLTTKNTKSS